MNYIEYVKTLCREFFHIVNYTIASWNGRVLTNMKLNNTDCIIKNDLKWFAKKRRWYSFPFILTGNIYLKVMQANIRFLFIPHWYIWEQNIYHDLYKTEIKIDNNGRLLFPALPGKLLTTVLQSSHFSSDQKVMAIVSAVSALRQLHLTNIRWPDGSIRNLSHGDATADNVFYDCNRRVAYWLDFETAHSAEISSEWRFADDLRAFTYSVAEHFRNEELEHVIKAILHTYHDEKILYQFKEYLNWWKYRPIAYHLAQAYISRKKKEMIENIIIHEIQIATITENRGRTKQS